MLTVRTELTDRMLIVGERHLRRVLDEYATHNKQRPHRALQLRPPRPKSPVPEPVLGTIRRRPILGGLINEYGSAAWNRWSNAMVESWNPTRSAVLPGSIVDFDFQILRAGNSGHGHAILNAGLGAKFASLYGSNLIGHPVGT